MICVASFSLRIMQVSCKGGGMKDGELGKLYAKGEVIFREGEKGDTMYVIQSGKVKITKKTAAEEIVIAEIGKGEIFGEMAMMKLCV